MRFDTHTLVSLLVLGFLAYILVLVDSVSNLFEEGSPIGGAVLFSALFLAWQIGRDSGKS